MMRAPVHSPAAQTGALPAATPQPKTDPHGALAMLSLPPCLPWLITKCSVNITTSPITFYFPSWETVCSSLDKLFTVTEIKVASREAQIRVREFMRLGCYETSFQLSHVFSTQLLKQLYHQSYLGQEPNRVWRFQSSILQPEIALPSIFTSSPASPHLQ